MNKAAVYRARAEQVRLLVAEAVTDTERAALRDIAETWDKLARQREQYDRPQDAT
jgi:hypothetical protein